MTAASRKRLREDPKVAEAIRREVENGPTSLTDDQVDLLRRLGAPGTRRTK